MCYMQKWLDYYGPFEAVVDAANVGLFSQKRFIPSKASYKIALSGWAVLKCLITINFLLMLVIMFSLFMVAEPSDQCCSEWNTPDASFKEMATHYFA